MNTEEKAKAYDEALERAKGWETEREQLICPREIVESIFPQLRESEDERVMKDIVAAVEMYGDFTQRRKEEIYAYLEKQKEQIPYIDFVIKPHKGDDNNPYDMRVSEAQEYAIKRGFGIPFNDGEVYVDERHLTQTIGNILRWADEHPKEQEPWKVGANAYFTPEQKPKHFELKAGKWYICHRAFCCRADHLTVKEGERFMCEKDGVVKGFIIKEPEKYFKECSAPAPMEDEEKEQKLAEWSEEDEDMLNSCISSIEEAKENRYAYKETDGDTSYDLEISFLKSLRPQSKQEWNEEDEKTVDAAIYWLKKVLSLKEVDDILIDDCPISIRKTVDRLKSLHLQPKQKLSKKDKKILLSLHHVMNCADAQNAVKRDGLSVEDVCNFLFSVEPNWKPSEEQMKHLERCFSHGHTSQLPNQHILESLYNELKKLM